jgi:hypothetical protein
MSRNSKLRKPRSNADAASYWAEHLLLDTPCDYRNVNSICLSAGEIQSFGSHYPLAKCFRRDDGTVRRVVLTTSYYPSKGFASTPSDQWNVKAAVQEAVARGQRAGLKIQLDYAPLSHYGAERIPVRPRADDPEPPEWYRTEVPALFTPSWRRPGPEPVKPEEGCIAHTREEYSYQSESYVLLDSDLRPNDFTVWHRYRDGEQKSLYVRRWHNGVLAWGDKAQSYDYFGYDDPQRSKVDYIQCPHCAAFDKEYEEWRHLSHGPPWGRGRGKGWVEYDEQIALYGSLDGWREARRQDVKRVRDGRKARKEWEERNRVPYDRVGRDCDRIPIVDEKGYARRLDHDAYLKHQNARKRDEQRLHREALEAQKIERGAARLRARRERIRAQRFEVRAAKTAAELARIADELASPTTELESRDD